MSLGDAVILDCSRRNFSHEQKLEIANQTCDSASYLLIVASLIKAIPLEQWSSVASRVNTLATDNTDKTLDRLCEGMR